jgi:hypothetical protein
VNSELTKVSEFTMRVQFVRRRSFDFMDQHFDKDLMNAGAFFEVPLSPNNDKFLNFPTND